MYRSYGGAVYSLVQCALGSVAAACAHFSRGTFMSRLVERQLVICPPRKNHECEGDAEDTTKGEQPLRPRDSSLKHAFQFSSFRFYWNPTSVLIVGCR